MQITCFFVFVLFIFFIFSESISWNFLYMLRVAVARSFSDGNAICYVLPVFVDDIMFSRNKSNGPQSKTTRMFRLVRQMAALGAKCAVSVIVIVVVVVRRWSGNRSARRSERTLRCLAAVRTSTMGRSYCSDGCSLWTRIHCWEESCSRHSAVWDNHQKRFKLRVCWSIYFTNTLICTWFSSSPRWLNCWLCSAGKFSKCQKSLLAFWQEVASPCCHTRVAAYAFVRCVHWVARSLAAGVMHSCVGTFQHTDRQTNIHVNIATSVAIGRIVCTACKRCVLNVLRYTSKHDRPARPGSCCRFSILEKFKEEE